MSLHRSIRKFVALGGLFAVAFLAGCGNMPTTAMDTSSPVVVIPTPSAFLTASDVITSAGGSVGSFGVIAPFGNVGRGPGPGAFWDNVSADNATCNIGFFGDGPWTSGLCKYMAPGSDANGAQGFDLMWGDNDSPSTPGKDASSFMFKGANGYTVTLLASYTLYPSHVGYYTKSGSAYTFTEVPQWTAQQVNFSVNIPTGANWGFFIANTFNPTQTGGCAASLPGNPGSGQVNCSDAVGSFGGPNFQQFALFAKSSDPAKYFVGAEDNRLELLPNGPGYDSDYNDYMWSVSATPGTIQQTGNQGCSLGYFKKHIQPNNGTLLGAVFTNTGTAATVSMQNALGFAGGPTLQDKKNLLLKQAAAAWFNVNYLAGNYPLTLTQLVNQVNAALASGNATTIGNLQTILDGYNNLEGPRC